MLLILQITYINVYMSTKQILNIKYNVNVDHTNKLYDFLNNTDK
jgi:hypothetical protein